MQISSGPTFMHIVLKSRTSIGVGVSLLNIGQGVPSCSNGVSVSSFSSGVEVKFHHVRMGREVSPFTNGRVYLFAYQYVQEVKINRSILATPCKSCRSVYRPAGRIKLSGMDIFLCVCCFLSVSTWYKSVGLE